MLSLAFPRHGGTCSLEQCRVPRCDYGDLFSASSFLPATVAGIQEEAGFMLD